MQDIELKKSYAGKAGWGFSLFLVLGTFGLPIMGSVSRQQGVVAGNDPLEKNPNDIVIIPGEAFEKKGVFTLQSGEVVNQFTQEQVLAGEVAFEHFYTEHFDVEHAGEHPNKDTNPLITSTLLTAASSVFGAALWLYRSQQDAKRQLESPLASLVRSELQLSDVDDFKSGLGVPFVEAIRLIEDRLKENHQINSKELTPYALFDLSTKVAYSLRAYLVDVRPDISERSRPSTLYYYYQQVAHLSSLRKQQWLDNDRVKSDAGTLAAQIAQPLESNEPQEPGYTLWNY